MNDGVSIPKSSVRAQNLIEWGVIIAVAVILALVVRAFVFQTFYIPSDSMVPRLETDDRILVNQLTYDIRDPKRTDVVVFRTPEAAHLTLEHLVKRIVGLPGDTIEGRDGHVLINGKVLDEPYLSSGVVTSPFSVREVPAGSYFMMGDNRSSSDDSRTWGPADRSLLVGPAFMTIWPLSRLDVPGWLWGVPIALGFCSLMFSRRRRRRAPRGVG